MSNFLRRSFRRSNSSSWFWFASRFHYFSHSLPHYTSLTSPFNSFLRKHSPCYNLLPSARCSYGCRQVLIFPTRVRFWVSQSEAAFLDTDHSTSDGLTVQGILANNWTILEENESDWRSHATAIAQSVDLIKRRLRVKLQILPQNSIFFSPLLHV